MGQFFNINNSPRFIEIWGEQEMTDEQLKMAGGERPVFRNLVNWNNILDIWIQEDGSVTLTLTDFSILSGDWIRFYLRMKEDFSHFVRRVNKGLAITMIRDRDE